MKSAQVTIDRLTGQDNTEVKGAPVNGPEDIDLAVADFANRVMRVYRYSPQDLAHLPAASNDLIAAARESFRNLNLKDARSLALPMQLALSFGTLFTESALRGLVTLDVVGPERVPRLVEDFFEMFTETPVFAGLEYPELIDRCEKRLAVVPNDYRVRMELARVMSKCGRYEDADVEFKKIPPESDYFAVAMHEAGVALYRAGRYEASVRAGTRSMDANPEDERPRSVMFQAAQKLGGYPSYVPPAHRMEMKAGYAQPTVYFEDIAARLVSTRPAAAAALRCSITTTTGYWTFALRRHTAGRTCTGITGTARSRTSR